ncbi:MAG: tRNA (guanosine(37)-N1)-methyltransferase TrmD [bacterium]
MIVFKVLSIFPKYFVSPFMDGLLKQAINKGILRIDVINIRDFTHDKHKTVDDEPYGGGPGMIMKPEPIVSAIRYAMADEKDYKTIVFSPKGKQFNQGLAKQLSKHDKFILVCGRYEGIDERVVDFYADEEISIGDYVLSGGEAAALVFIESITRLIPGFVGNEASIKDESYEDGLLEYPQYTKPRVFEGHEVPAVLLSGNHEQIKKWRKEQSLRLTAMRRPDLLDKAKKDQHL